MRTFDIEEPDEGRLLAGLLRNALPDAPRSFLRKVVRDGAVTLNGLPPPPDARLHAGDRVLLKESARVLGFLAGGPCALDVILDDPDLLALNKPAGLAVHPTDAADGDDLATRAAALAPALGHAGAYHVVNRLDRWTSGVVLLVPGAARAADHARLFESRQVDKRYLALVAGDPPAEGVAEGPVDGRPARTAWTVLARGPRHALLHVRPETGRRHQIRVHLASAGHPLAGDRRYGGPPLPGVGGALLHAVSLAFLRPRTDIPLLLVAPVPRSFRDALRTADVPSAALAAALRGMSLP